MNINFPDNPNVGDAFESGGTIFRCINVNPAVWTATPAADPVPDGPVDGLMYGRKDGAWQRAVSVSGDTMLGPLNLKDGTGADYHLGAFFLDTNGLNIQASSAGAATASKLSINIAAAAKPQLVLSAAGAVWNLNGMAVNANSGSSAELTLNKQTGATANNIWGLRNGVIRWILQMGSELAESSGNVGSDFVINAYSDTGTYLSTPLKVARANGAITFNGVSVSLSPPTGDARIDMNRSVAASSSAIINGKVAGLSRWNLILGAATAEPGANAGSDFYIQRSDDAGNYLGNTVHISRQTGQVDLANALVVTGNISGAAGTFSSNLTAGQGMGFVWDGANANFLRMGSSGSTWSWQWNRSTGGLVWLGGSAQQLFAVDGTGNVDGAWFRASSGQGIQCNGVQSDGSTYALQSLVLGNPSWGVVDMRSRHQYGQWAGWEFVAGSSGTQIRFSMSNGQAWGTIQALAFEVQSDERGKVDVVDLPRQHDSFMQIQPIEWSLPAPQKTSDEFPVYAGHGVKWGFSAQNLTKYVPLAVNGDVLAVDGDGKPITASVDVVPIVALTVLEVQALCDRIEMLEARLVTLETGNVH